MIKKTEWNLNGSGIIIPVTNADSSEAVTIFGKDGNCIIPSDNSNLVIGLNKTLVESHKTDLLIIQDSDLKLLSCNPEVKNQLGYSFPLIDQNDTLLKNTEQNKFKKWSNENAVLGVKNIFVYNKNEEINLDYAEESNSYSTKLKEDVLREVVDEHTNENNYQLIIEYNSDCYAIIPKEENCGITGESKTQNVIKEIISERGANNFNDFKEGDHESKSKIKQISNNTLIENSLPLKKKAKMKTVSSENQRSLLKEELMKSKKMESNFSFENKEHQLQSRNKQELNNDDLERSLQNSSNKRRKIQKMTYSYPVSKTSQKAENESKAEFDITKFKSIFDLVEGLRKHRMISVSIWQILNAGLKEMNVDVLDEIVKKMENLEGNYSPHLKAFALILYFKQPAAFNFLARVYKSGWPTLNVIKEWKLQLNSHQRPNFRGMERNADDIS